MLWRPCIIFAHIPWIAGPYRCLSQRAFPGCVPFAHDPGTLNVSPQPPGKESEAMNIAMTERKPAAARSLKDKVSVITGSTSGIGLGIARALAGAGTAIVLNGFGKPEEIEAVRDGVAKEFGVHVAYSGADMSNPASIAEMIEMTLDEFGRIDVLVNNAGIQHV